MGGHDEKLKNFGKSKKKSVIFTNQTISSKKFFLKKNFWNWDSKCHFLIDFERKWKYFLIDRSKLTRYSETRSLSDKTVRLKSFESSRWPRKLTFKSRLGSAWQKKFQISSDSKTVSIFGICITSWPKKSPTPFPKSSGLPRYNKLGQISCWLKIDIFKLGQIQKIVSFLERGSFTENNGTITNV